MALQSRVDRADPWGLARLLEAMPAKERHLLGAALLQDADILLRVDQSGTTYFVPPSLDVIVSDLIEVGSYEPQEIESVLAYTLRHRPPNEFPVVVDVGANIGTTTVPFAQHDYRVIAIEPVPETAQLLRMNLGANQLDERCDVIERAVADHDSEVIMRVQNALGVSEIVSAEVPDSSRVAGDYRDDRIGVRAQPLATILTDADVDPTSVALVWSDTEGCEAATVGSGETLWRAGVPLWVEVSAYTLRQQGGLTDFVTTATSFFSAFVTRESLFARPGDPVRTSIADLAAFIETSGASRWDYTNILLLR